MEKGTKVRIKPNDYKPELAGSVGVITDQPDPLNKVCAGETRADRKKQGIYRRGFDGYPVTFDPPVKHPTGKCKVDTFMDWELEAVTS